MSYASLVCVNPGIDAKTIDSQRYHNSFRGAILLWSELVKRYLPASSDSSYWLSNTAKMQELWSLADSSLLEIYERRVLAMTFDNWYVAKKDFKQAGTDIGLAMQKLCFGGHWVLIRDYFNSDPDVPAIGSHWTSVTEGPFNIHRQYDPETDESYATYQFDWSKATSVYDEIKAVQSTNA